MVRQSQIAPDKFAELFELLAQAAADAGHHDMHFLLRYQSPDAKDGDLVPVITLSLMPCSNSSESN